jgi:hypothetical protein
MSYRRSAITPSNFKIGNNIIMNNILDINPVYTAPGTVLSISMLNYTGVNQASTTTINSSSYQIIATGSYQPVSKNSIIIFEYNTAYAVDGGAADDFYSDIIVNGSEITYGYQNFNNSSGGGSRSGTIFPLIGSYRNTSSTPIIYGVQAKRGTSDDSITVYGDNSTWLKITEIATV